jgi:precorrin-6B methylase 2
LAFVPASSAQQQAPVYETKSRHDPYGIGKFYMGREIARVMGPGGASWLERPERGTEEQPQLLLNALAIKEGQTVADLGAGSGYYTFRLAPLVGEKGRVLAIDIEPAMLRMIGDRAKREEARNVVTIRSTARDPKLPIRGVDLVMMVDVYHELEYPFEVMTKVRESLKPGGRLALIEYREEDPAVRILPVHKMSERQIVRELQAAGFRHVQTIGTLPLQHLVIFTPKGDAGLN